MTPVKEVAPGQDLPGAHLSYGRRCCWLLPKQSKGEKKKKWNGNSFPVCVLQPPSVLWSVTRQTAQRLAAINTLRPVTGGQGALLRCTSPGGVGSQSSSCLTSSGNMEGDGRMSVVCHLYFCLILQLCLTRCGEYCTLSGSLDLTCDMAAALTAVDWDNSSP